MASQLPVRVRPAATVARAYADTTIQVRRTLRASTRATVVNNKENATSRAVRASTRAKPPSTAADPKATATRITASTAATRAKSTAPPSRPEPVQGKRKREALGEVPRPPANLVRQEREPTGAKGKGKASKEAFDGVELKKPVSTARGPLKVVASASKTTVTTTMTTTTRRTRSITAAQVKEEVKVEPPRAHHRARERSQPTRLTQVKEEPELKDEDAMAVDPIVPVRALSVRRQPPATAGARREALRRVQAAKTEHDRDEEEYRRAYKKQRTSSEAPEAELAEVEEVVQIKEADLDDDDWDDLDAEDMDDPLMVSEYVVEIFQYLKEVEVSLFLSTSSLSDVSLAINHAQPQLHGDAKGSCVENARHPHRLARPGALAFPSSPGDAFPEHQYHRPFPVLARGVPRQASAGRRHLYVHRCKGRGNCRALCE